jgi:hypothetical protein
MHMNFLSLVCFVFTGNRGCGAREVRYRSGSKTGDGSLMEERWLGVKMVAIEDAKAGVAYVRA